MANLFDNKLFLLYINSLPSLSFFLFFLQFDVISDAAVYKAYCFLQFSDDFNLIKL